MKTFWWKLTNAINTISIVLMCSFLHSGCKKSKESERDLKEKPNIVFILSDDHASAVISSYGCEIIRTPNIDRIAQKGVRFTNAFVTSSLCAPARAAILTGKYAEKNGFRRIGDIFDGSQTTIQGLLQKGGYETAVFGKWHLGSKPTNFDYYEVVRGQGLFFNPAFYKIGMEWNKDWKSVHENDEGIINPGYFTDILTDKTITWLQDRETDEPFALFVHHKAPHSPHVTPERYDSIFIEEISRPLTYDDTYEGKNSFLRNNKGPDYKLINTVPAAVINSREDLERIRRGVYESPEEVGTLAYKDWAFQTLFKGYYRQIVNLDENIGRLLDYIEETDLEENTIIVYVSDNGWFLGNHGLYNKMWMYEESLKVPLIIKYADRYSANSVEESLVSILDFAPTFLDYAGVEIPSSLQGESLRPLLEGNKPQDWRTAFFYHYYDQFQVPEQYGIRTQDHKLIKFFDSSGTNPEYELYDLIEDPQEMNNLWNNPQYNQLQDSLMQELEQQKRRFES